MQNESEKRLSALERFLKKVNMTNDCWEWTGAKHSAGYGAFSYNQHPMGAHRFLYQMLFGDVPEGLELDHLCRNRSCVRPSHLEAVTHGVNVQRGTSWYHFVEEAKKITHCPQGHEYTKENTYITPKKPTRHCRECVRNRAREYKRRKAKATKEG